MNGLRLAGCKTVPLPWLIVCCCITALLMGGVGLLWFIRRRISNDQGLLELRLRAMQSDIAALSACQVDAMERALAREQHLRAIEGRIEAAEQRLRQIARRQEEQLHVGEPGETSYGAAIRLAHQGANVDQLVSTFGLARGEAELIAALHRAESEKT